MLKVTLPDGSVKEYSRRVRPIDIAAEIGPRLAKATLAAAIDGQIVGADTLLPEEGDIRLRLLTRKDAEALDVMRHSCAHVMARAVMRLFEGVQLAFGPTVDNGFYYDFQLERPISEADFPAIEAEMAKIVKEDEPFERIEEPRDEAVELCRDLGQSLKVEHIDEGLADEATVSFYRQGEFIDLCRGPHVPSAGAIGAFKLLVGRGGLLEGRRLAPAAPAALRHGLVRQGGPGSLSQAGRRGQAARPPRAGQAAGAVHHRPDGRLGPGPLAAQGGDRPPRAGELPLRRADEAATSRSTRRTSAGSSCTRLRAIIRITPTASSRRSRWPTASATCSSR